MTTQATETTTPSRATCAHCGLTILRRGDGVWFSRGSLRPTGECETAADGKHAPANENGVVQLAREAIADATDIRHMTVQEMGGMIGRLTGTMQGLLEYIDLLHKRVELVQQIADRKAGTAEWPPQPGDLWRDRNGLLWFAVESLRSETQHGPVLLTCNGRNRRPAADINDLYAPLTLVHREDGAR